MFNPNAGNPDPNSPADTNGQSRPSYQHQPTNYDPIASHLARLTLEQSSPFSQEDIFHHARGMRIQSAAAPNAAHQFPNYATINLPHIEGLFNGSDHVIPNGNPYNSTPNLMNGEAVNYNTRHWPDSSSNPFINFGVADHNYNLYHQRLNAIRNYNAAFCEHELMNYYDNNNNSRCLDAFNNLDSQMCNGGYVAPRANGGIPMMNLNRNIDRRPRQRANFATSLREIRGKIVTVAKDQYGCRFLQGKFEEGNPEEIQMIFMEIKDHICELMVHQFGNYLIQKFLEVCTQEQMTKLLMLVINDEAEFADICSDMYGTRAVQKLLEHLTTQEQRRRIISVLRRITVALTRSMNGHHVIQHCLKFFSIEDNKHILNVVADNCLDIATDKSGCCVLQQCLEYALGEPRQRLIAELTSNALILSQHPFGNYVVQYILGLKIGHVTVDIMRQLSGNFVTLCMDKYGSNVVEKCLREAGESQRIVQEMIDSPNFLRVLQDPYGNYVAQSALNASKGPMLHALMDLINSHASNLHSHPHGKRVLEKVINLVKTTKGMRPSYI
ncbi:hypothetical protein ACS0TY_002733 [Phlomoides rotata]